MKSPHFRRIIVPFMVAVTVFSAEGAKAQVSGAVVGEGGEPVPYATVEAWGNGTRIAAGSADQSGRFLFSGIAPQDVARITVSALGYDPASFRPSSGGGPYRFTLRIRPFPLSEIIATTVRSRCPLTPDARADSLWEAAAAKYSPETDFRGVSAWVRKTSGDVMEYDLGMWQDDELRGSETRWVGAANTPGRYSRYVPTDSVVSHFGYAYPPPRGRTGRRYLNWAYLEFDGRDAHHFRSPVFAERHDLRVIDEEDGYILAFCPSPTHSGDPEISGEIWIDSDTTFSGARWEFRTPDPREGAGGQVLLGRLFRAGDRLPHLIPLRGVYWRHNGREPPYPEAARSYFQEVRVWDEWIISPDDAAPEWRARP